MGEKMKKIITRSLLMAVIIVSLAAWGRTEVKAAGNVPAPVFQDGEEFQMASGMTHTFHLSGTENIQSAQWSVSDESVLKIVNDDDKEKAEITALKYSEDVKLIYTYTWEENSGGSTTQIHSGSIEISVRISDPTLSVNGTIYLSTTNSAYNSQMLEITGLLPESKISLSETASGLYTYSNELHNCGDSYGIDVVIFALSSGDNMLNVTVDGKTIQIRVVALALQFNRTSKTIGDMYSNVYVKHEKAVFSESKSMLALYNGSSVAITLSGTQGNTVNWQSSNPLVATVSGYGESATVKGMGQNGYATITATVAGSIRITYKVGVGPKAAIKTLLAGEKQQGAKYSQAKRMRKGYFDCSSFVWSMYRKYGYNFGVKSGWAPTAALEAQYATTHYKIISYSRYDESKMLPGDVIFYSSKKNGRFMNITHIALYIKPGTRIDAHVVPSYHVGERESTGLDVVMVVRPTSKKTTAVTSLKTGSIKSNSVSLNWSPANSVTGYKVYKYNTSKKKYVLYKTLSSKKETCTVKGLKSKTEYTFKVRAYKKTGKKTKLYKAATIKIRTK
jgi:cell wall-associated NlpC family hydrolase